VPPGAPTSILLVSYAVAKAADDRISLNLKPTGRKRPDRASIVYRNVDVLLNYENEAILAKRTGE
jgi:ABC-type sulfate transport system substrate-binding protein